MANPYFDAAYYLSSNPDVEAAGIDPEAHYLHFGASEGRQPAAWFNGAYYLSQNPDLEKGGITIQTAFAHFQAFGSIEGRSPSPTVSLTSASLSAYAAANADLAKAFGITDPAYLTSQQKAELTSHYYQFGHKEGRPSDPAVAPVGETFTLTQGLDEFVGTSGNDVFNAYAFNAVTGGDVTTLNSVDSIDGGAGNDTLNIEVKGTLNASLQGTIKNVETININNTAATTAAATSGAIVDASKFVGATAINQIGKVAADGVTNLGDATAAGFKDTAATAALKVSSSNTATKAAVALDGAGEGSTITFAVPTVAPANGGALNSIAITGTVKDSNDDGKVGTTNVEVTVGRDVQTLSVNTAVATTLTAVNSGAGTKEVSTVDASASTGGVTFVNAVPGTPGIVAATIANIKGGSGVDVLELATAYSSTVATATIDGGAGNDTLDIRVSNAAADIAGATVSAIGGTGNDTINLNVTNGATKAVGVTVDAGDGDDTVNVGTFAIKSTDSIDGGAGTDTVAVGGKAARNADDFIVFNKVLKNFETIKFTTAEGLVATKLDASLLGANYSTLDFAAGSFVDNVTTQSLISRGNLTAEAKGYVNVGEGTPAATAITYAGTLNINALAAGTINAHAETVNLTVTGGKGDSTALPPTIVANDAILTGEAKTATVALTAGTDTKGTVTTTDDVFVASQVSITTANVAEGLSALTSLTLSGNGTATITNADSTALVTVDASALNSVDITGKAATGLVYVTTNTKAETIKLGGGLDSVDITGSTYTIGQTKMDTVEGLNLVVTGGLIDATKGDVLVINGMAAGGLTADGKFTTTQTDLDLALLDAAKFQTAAGLAVDNVAFHLNGNTYVYSDATGDNLVTTDDILVKLVGTIDLDSLVAAI